MDEPALSRCPQAIILQPFAPGFIDPKPSGGVAGYINDEQLILNSHVRFQPVSYRARRISALHDPDGFKVMPPGAKRLYGFDEVIIRIARRRVNVIAISIVAKRGLSIKRLNAWCSGPLAPPERNFSISIYDA